MPREGWRDTRKHVAIPVGAGMKGPAAWSGGWRHQEFLIQWDGEIYNRSGLRRELNLPQETPDPLLVLKGWKKKGASFLHRINGPFALALWDLRQKTCCLARGDQGLRALFMAVNETGVAFARTKAILLRLRWVSKEPFWERIPEYLVFNHVAGGWTLYRDIRELLPGEMFVIRFGQRFSTSLHRPTDSLFPGNRKMDGDHVGEAQRLLLGSTARLVAASGGKETPALFLSGGVDSALLAALLQRIRPREGIPCYTVTCPGYKHDEGPYARAVASSLGFPLKTSPLRAESFSQGWSRLIRALRYPQTSTNQVPWWILCEEAAKGSHHTVFSGEGADGPFSGGLYEWERREIASSGPLESFGVARRVIFCRTHCLNDPHVIRSIVRIPLRIPHRFALWRRILRAQGPPLEEAAVTYHLHTTGVRLLTRADQAAFHFGIRLELPFLEARWRRWLRSLRFDQRNPEGIPKGILKALCAERWGKALAHRKKVGFPFPLRTWIRDSRVPLLVQWRKMLLEERTLSREIYRRETLQEAIRLRLEGRLRPIDWLLWSLLNLELWLRNLGY